MQDFFNTVPLVVRQPQTFFGDFSEYYCFDQRGNQVAHIHELGVDTGMQVLRVLGPLGGQNMQRRVVINDAWQRPRLYIHKDWSFATASTSILAPNGALIGRINQQLKLMKAEFHLVDAHNRFVGAVRGDLLSHDFQIFDHQQHEVCRVNRRLANLGEIFTSADTYVVWLRYLDLPEPLKTLVLASSITIDLVLAEGKR